jgi:uncharacterized protein (TIGR02118 family)
MSEEEPDNMYKATVLYGVPPEAEAFDRHYTDVHIPLAQKIPGIAHWTVTRCDPGPDGGPPPFYLVAELYADTRAGLLDAFASPEGRTAAADVARFAHGGATFLFGDEAVVTTTPSFRAGL